MDEYAAKYTVIVKNEGKKLYLLPMPNGNCTIHAHEFLSSMDMLATAQHDGRFLTPVEMALMRHGNWKLPGVDGDPYLNEVVEMKDEDGNVFKSYSYTTGLINGQIDKLL